MTSGQVVETENGRISGVEIDGVRRYTGIRYGASTAGENRFRAPRPPESWTGVRQTVDFGDVAPQTDVMGGPVNPADHDVKAPGLDVLASAGSARQGRESEDCLVLNVWVPADHVGELLPVAVWLHGGGFDTGSGSEPMYDGARLARDHGVVVVTVNHRLFTLGYLHLADILGDEFADSGNIGTLDQVAALEWVRRNIEAFGGDRERVMVFGQSGGGWKVSTLLRAPRADGLFRRAIIQSGPAVRGLSRERADIAARLLLEELNISPARARELRDVPVEWLITAGFRVERRIGAPILPNYLPAFAPVDDDHVVFAEPSERAVPVDLAIGHTRTELTLYGDAATLDLDDQQLEMRAREWLGASARQVVDRYRDWYPDASPSRLWGQIQTDVVMLPDVADIVDRHVTGGERAYVYRIDWETPILSGRLMAPHGIELPLIFGTFRDHPELTGVGPRVEAMSRRMSAAWAAFARTGTPCGDGLPEWPPHDPRERRAIIFDDESVVARHPRADQLDLARSVRPVFAERLRQRTRALKV